MGLAWTAKQGANSVLCSGGTRHSGPWQFHPGPGFKQGCYFFSAVWYGPDRNPELVRAIENWTNDRGHDPASIPAKERERNPTFSRLQAHPWEPRGSMCFSISRDKSS